MACSVKDLRHSRSSNNQTDQMLSRAYQDGVRAASKQFDVRVASWMDVLLGIGTPMAARAGLNAFSPKLLPAVEKRLEAPFKAVKDVGGGLVRALRSPTTPADALTRQLATSSIPSTIEHTPVMQSAPMPHIEHALPPRGLR